MWKVGQINLDMASVVVTETTLGDPNMSLFAVGP